MSDQKTWTERRDKLISLLESCPKGITSSEVKENLKITPSALYSLVYNLKKQGVKIKNKNRKYYLASQKNLPIVQQSTTHDDTFSNQKHLNLMVHLSESDKHDYLDMLKKSIFYKLSANAIIQANNIINDIRQSTIL
jgi:biotin operon repressor